MSHSITCSEALCTYKIRLVPRQHVVSSTTSVASICEQKASHGLAIVTAYFAVYNGQRKCQYMSHIKLRNHGETCLVNALSQTLQCA